MRLTAGHEHGAFQGLRYACVQVFGLLRWQGEEVHLNSFGGGFFQQKSKPCHGKGEPGVFRLPFNFAGVEVGPVPFKLGSAFSQDLFRDFGRRLQTAQLVCVRNP